MSKRRAALFDMDRTLVRANTGTLYVRWMIGRGEAGWRDLLRVSGWVVQYTLGIADSQRIATEALATLVGTTEDEFRARCEQWFRETVAPHISEAARREVRRRVELGDLVAVLSASSVYAVEPLAAELGIPHVVCTTLAVADGRFTGRCEELCYGAAKVTMAERWAEEQGVDLGSSVFYTDSISDLPMLERVGEPRVINPDPRLRWVAARRGWRVERW